MRTLKFFGLVLVITGLVAAQSVTHAAPACKGQNKNDPDCGTATEPAPEEPAPAEAAAAGPVDSASVDWFNQNVTVRGSGLDSVLEYTLGGSAPLSPTTKTTSEVVFPFDADVAGEVASAGNYALKADGTDIISIYFKSQVVETAATGCPCEAEWSTQLGALSLWGPPLETECLEILGPSGNDTADIAGTVLTDPNDPSVYPQFPIGASFIPGDPVNSSCRLVQVDGDATTTELVNFRINENQQEDCAASLKLHVCGSTLPAP